MTESEMNVKLCEKLGFTIEDHERGDGMMIVRYWRDGKLFSHLPNHFADTPEGLWACHQAEKELSGKEPEYIRRLENEVCKHLKVGWSFALANATSPQRAPALYQTLCE